MTQADEWAMRTLAKRGPDAGDTARRVVAGVFFTTPMLMQLMRADETPEKIRTGRVTGTDERVWARLRESVDFVAECETAVRRRILGGE